MYLHGQAKHRKSPQIHGLFVATILWKDTGAESKGIATVQTPPENGRGRDTQTEQDANRTLTRGIRTHVIPIVYGQAFGSVKEGAGDCHADASSFVVRSSFPCQNG